MVQRFKGFEVQRFMGSGFKVYDLNPTRINRKE